MNKSKFYLNLIILNIYLKKMNKRKLLIQFIFILSLFNIYKSQDTTSQINLSSSDSYYYDEKYFRLLTNNYDEINPGNVWKDLNSDGIGFKANKNFGSIILLKDWSMYNFKLTHIFFRKNCSFNYENFNCDAEMWLYHTKDNQYYPPGRRIFMEQNFFIIVVPFVRTDNNNPANDLLLDYLNLESYNANKKINKKISPKKPVKLHHIIQNQPSYLFEGKYNETNTLFMVFTQYHFISEKLYNTLVNIEPNKEINTNIICDSKIYRNVRKLEEIKPSATLMAYSKGSYLKNIFAIIVLFLIFIY
jgi:hypothetical protein